MCGSNFLHVASRAIDEDTVAVGLQVPAPQHRAPALVALDAFPCLAVVGVVVRLEALGQ